MWLFQELERGDIERDPHEAEFFNTGENDYPTQLVREFVQNALDAAASPNSKVIIRFTIGHHLFSNADQFYQDLLPHAKHAGFDVTLNSKKARFLVIEDFNTTGLDGSISAPANGGSNYYNFWWREGKSQKEGQSAGRWGLGKTVYHSCSCIRTFWGYTKRIDDGKTLLLGKALLKSHIYNGKRFKYFGFYSKPDYSPIADPQALQLFKNKFQLSRNNEAGLSLVIPMPVDEIDSISLLKAMIIHYFYPIIKGNLEAKFTDLDKGISSTLDSSNLKSIATNLNWEGTSWENRSINSLMSFLEQTLILSNTKPLTLQLMANEKKMSPDVFGSNLEEIRRKYETNELLFFRLNVIIAERKKAAQKSYVDIFIQKDESLEQPDEMYFRSGIIISEIHLLHSKRVRTLLAADHKYAATFLGDSESPAHTEWKERTENFQNKYTDAVTILRFIRTSVREIMKILDIPRETVEKDFLADIFFISNEEGTISDKGNQSPVTVQSNPEIVKMSKIDGGFRLALSNDNVIFPLHIFVKAAYDIRRGNPFSKHSPLDFDISANLISKEITGGKILRLARNGLWIRIDESDFKLDVRGFDKTRDLVVNTKEVKNEA